MNSAVGSLRTSWRPVVRCQMAGIALLLASGPALAGGPLYVTANGAPYRWDQSKPVRFMIDGGPLGTCPHDQAAADIRQAFQRWQAVPGASLTAEGTELTQDIDGSNVMAFLDGLKPTDPSPVLLDSDGSIFDTLTGPGTGAEITGLGAPTSVNSQSGTITTSMAILNGRLLCQYRESYRQWAITHEIGHFLGLAHSQVNEVQIYDGDPDDDGLTAAMCLRGPDARADLQADDRAWFSWMYPSSTYGTSTGSIQGTVLLPDGQTGLQGVEVIARRVGDPDVTAIGSVSGFRFRNHNSGGGANDLSLLGQYVIPGLPPGSYTVEVQELDVNPGVPNRPMFLVGGPKFWRNGSSAQDPPGAFAPIVVSAGQEITGINIVLNGESLGTPRPVTLSSSQPSMAPQPVSLPAVISGAIPDAANGSTPPPRGIGQVMDACDVDLPDWTIVTAILNAPQKAADLDLYVWRMSGNSRVQEGASADRGTSQEVVQLRLPPGHHFFGVARSGMQGSPYTLFLLATPAPEPAKVDFAQISEAVLGDVTATGATLHWQTTVAAPSIVYYNLPLREIGSTARQQTHVMPLTDLPPGTTTMTTIIAQSGSTSQEHDEVTLPVTTSRDSSSRGKPALTATAQIKALSDSEARVVVTLANGGGGDALDVQIRQVLLPTGWEMESPMLSAAAVPPAVQVGRVAAGSAGAYVARVARHSGAVALEVTAHGTYTDSSGALLSF